jgi:hypothetical protein
MVKNKSSIDILTDSLLQEILNNDILKDAGFGSSEVKSMIKILADEQFSDDNRKVSKSSIDKILDRFIEQEFGL